MPTRADPSPASDEQVRALLERYKCPVPFHEVPTRFLSGSLSMWGSSARHQDLEVPASVVDDQPKPVPPLMVFSDQIEQIRLRCFNSAVVSRVLCLNLGKP